MPITRTGTLFDFMLTVTNVTLGTPAGSRRAVASPYRGRVVEAGFTVDSAATSGITFKVEIGDNQVSSTASTFTEIISSTLGTFSSVGLYEGNVMSVVPVSPAYIKMGDSIQFTSSGGQSSSVTGTYYALIRKG